MELYPDRVPSGIDDWLPSRRSLTDRRRVVLSRPASRECGHNLGAEIATPKNFDVNDPRTNDIDSRYPGVGPERDRSLAWTVRVSRSWHGLEG